MTVVEKPPVLEQQVLVPSTIGNFLIFKGKIDEICF